MVAIYRIVLLTYHISSASLLLKPKESVLNVPSKIVEQFRNYGMVFHYDNETALQLHSFFIGGFNNTVNLLNYDKVDVELRRPLGLRYIHVVFLTNPMEFNEFASRDYYLRNEDVVLILVHTLLDDSEEIQRFLNRIFKIQGLYRAGELFVYDVSSDFLYNCCFYCGNKSEILNLVEKNGDLTELVNDFRDFNGHEFVIGYTNFPPFFTCFKNAKNECIPTGSESDLLATLSKYLNFTYKLIKIDGENGRGDWEEMVIAVNKRKVHWAIGGISVSIIRGDLTDFTRFIHTESFKVVFTTQKGHWTSARDIVGVFQWPVFLCGSVTVVFIGFIARIVAGFSRFSDNGTVVGYMGAALSSLLEQPMSEFLRKHPWHFSLKALFLLWWLLSLCITTMYKSKLAAFLIKPSVIEPRMIADLVENGYMFQANNEDWSVLKENFEESPVLVYKEVLKRVKDDLNFCDSVVYALDAKVGVIDEETPLIYELMNTCASRFSSTDRWKLKLLEENLFPGGYHAWCMQMSTPFRKKFSSLIGRFYDFGLITHWYDSGYVEKINQGKQNEAENTLHSLDLMAFMGPLAVLSVGFSVSLCTFALEIVVYWNKARK